MHLALYQKVKAGQFPKLWVQFPKKGPCLPWGQDLASKLGLHWHFQLGGRIAVLRRQRPDLATRARREGVIFGPSRSGLGLRAGTIWVPPPVPKPFERS